MPKYTELIFGAELKKDTPGWVIEALLYMMGDIEKPRNFPECLEANLFQSDSESFAVNNSCTDMWLDKITGTWRISVRCSHRNINDSIDTFLEWIRPHILSGSGNRDMFAIVLFEDEDEPVIYYLKNKD